MKIYNFTVIKEESPSCLMLSEVILKYKRLVIESPELIDIPSAQHKELKYPGQSCILIDKASKRKVDLALFIHNQISNLVYIKVGEVRDNDFDIQLASLPVGFRVPDSVKALTNKDYVALDKAHEYKYALSFFLD